MFSLRLVVTSRCRERLNPDMSSPEIFLRIAGRLILLFVSKTIVKFPRLSKLNVYRMVPFHLKYFYFYCVCHHCHCRVLFWYSWHLRPQYIIRLYSLRLLVTRLIQYAKRILMSLSYVFQFEIVVKLVQNRFLKDVTPFTN